MRPGDRLLSRLRDIVYYGDRAKETVRNRQFAEMESVEIDALCYLVLIVTEAALRALALDPQIATRHGEIPWHEIRGTGNRLRHGYATLDRQEFVKSAVADGAQVVTGGELIELDNGNLLQPTVLTNFNEGMAVMRDEVFIPVLPLRRSAVSTKAIERANDSTYGLTSSIYTTNLNSALRAINELEFGETYVNRENFEAMQGFHAGMRRSGIGGADGEHGLYVSHLNGDEMVLGV